MSICIAVCTVLVFWLTRPLLAAYLYVFPPRSQVSQWKMIQIDDLWRVCWSNKIAKSPWRSFITSLLAPTSHIFIPVLVLHILEIRDLCIYSSLYRQKIQQTVVILPKSSLQDFSKVPLKIVSRVLLTIGGTYFPKLPLLRRASFG